MFRATSFTTEQLSPSQMALTGHGDTRGDFRGYVVGTFILKVSYINVYYSLECYSLQCVYKFRTSISSLQ